MPDQRHGMAVFPFAVRMLFLRGKPDKKSGKSGLCQFEQTGCHIGSGIGL